MEKQTHKEYPFRTTEAERQYQRNYYQKNKEKLLALQRSYNVKNAAYSKQLRDKRKKMVFDHYGNKCACCNELESKFLSIDHVNNDGNIERKKRGGGRSTTIYYNIIRANYPDTYQILCMNCNTGKSRNNGVCPHNYFNY